MEGEIFFDYGFMPEDGRAVPDGPSTDPECDHCRQLADIAEDSLAIAERSLGLAERLAGIAEDSLGAAEQLAGIASELAGERASLEEDARLLQKERAALAGDNERLSRANKKLNAEKNNIKTSKTVPGKDRTSSGRPGRRPGCKPTINRRPTEIDREETVDVTTCPEGHPLSEKVSDRYTRVVRITHVWRENVMFTVLRRRCPTCDKIISAQPPGIRKYARRSANHQATLVSLHMNGLSHGKAAEFSGDALKCPVSRSTSFRDKISSGGSLTHEHDDISKKILSEPFLYCDEFWWPISGSNGGAAMVALGGKTCLIMVVDSATIKRVKEMLPGYQGIIIQDSKAIWLHGSSRHQMCMWHQHRLYKKDLNDGNPKGDALRFVSAMDRITLGHYRADKITDQHTREVAARCLDKQRSELIHHRWGEERCGQEGCGPDGCDNCRLDEDGRKTIARHIKRHRREGYFYTTHLYRPEIAPDNNAVERVNRKFVAIRSDGGGNRSVDGMKANSVLFTIMATDRLNGASFFDHLVRASSGDG